MVSNALHLALAAFATLVSASQSTTSSAPKSCATTYDANHDNIPGAELGAVTIPTPYDDLDYIGWQAVATIDVGNTAVSPIQPHSPPGTIFFNGNDDTGVQSFNAGNGINYFNLTSVYIACAVAPGVGTIASAVNVPTSCTVEAIGTQTNGGRVTATLMFILGTANTLYTFPSTFVNLKSVNFLLTATAATSGLTVVDFDDTMCTVSKACT